MRKYNEWDFLKCTATLLVVIGHITILYKQGGSFPQLENKYLSQITDIIYLFHMPLFMAISGSIYAIGRQNGKYKDLKLFISNKSKRLLVPYYFTAIIFLFPTIIFLHMHNDETKLEYFSKILVGIDCRHLWFLWALFEIFIIAFFCKNKKKNSTATFLILSIIASLINSYYNNISIFCIPMAIYYLPYFFLGELLIEKNVNNTKKLKISFLSIIISGCIIKLNNIIWIDTLFSIIINGSIITFIYSIASFFFREEFFANPIMSLLYKNSFSIYLFHVPIIYILIYFFQDFPIFILLPIVGIISLTGSVIIANILRKIRLNKFIGE